MSEIKKSINLIRREDYAPTVLVNTGPVFHISQYTGELEPGISFLLDLLYHVYWAPVSKKAVPITLLMNALTLVTFDP